MIGYFGVPIDHRLDHMIYGYAKIPENLDFLFWNYMYVNL